MPPKRLVAPLPVLGTPHGHRYEATKILLRRYGLNLVFVLPGAEIPASYWGTPEAGLIRATLYARADTPMHSVLHEASHYVCMTPTRRTTLHRDAGDDVAEENAVCYLSILLADRIPAYGRGHMFRDMDSWGYTFRLGSARRWFYADADDARAWLVAKDLLQGTEKGLLESKPVLESS